VKNPAELASATDLPSSTQKFSLHISAPETNESFYLSLDAPFTRHCAITGPEGSWCASVVHEVERFFEQTKRWYWWIRYYRLGLISWMVFVVLITLMSFGTIKFQTNAARGGLLVFIGTATFLYFVWDWLFPWVTLQLKDQETFYKKYQTEITLAAMVISAAAALIAVFK